MRATSRTIALACLALATRIGAGDRLPPAQGRDPTLQPFADTSIWNTPLGTGVRLLPADDIQTRMLRSGDVGGPNGSYPWIADGPVNLYRSSDSDPVARWHYDTRTLSRGWTRGGALRNGEISVPTPTGLVGAKNSDREAVLIEPDGRHALEGWLIQPIAKGERYDVSYLVEVDLFGSGIADGEGQSAGVRGFGGSLLGGMVRCEELRRGSIQHAVAVVLSDTQMKMAANWKDRKVWPAMVADAGSENIYKGAIPMGSLLAISRHVDLTSLDLTPEGLTLARAYQQFGGYVVDTATRTAAFASLENGCSHVALKNLFADVIKIRSVLSIVANNSAKHPGGPGERVAPRPPRLRP